MKPDFFILNLTPVMRNTFYQKNAAPAFCIFSTDLLNRDIKTSSSYPEHHSSP